MTRNELMNIIKDIVVETTELKEVEESADFIKKGIINHKLSMKSAAIFDGDIKDIKSKFNLIKGDKADSIEVSLAANTKFTPGKLQFGVALNESVEYITEFFGSNKDKNSMKVGPYTITVIGTTSKGYPVAVCEKIKVHGMKVSLYSTADYSIFNPNVLHNVAQLANIVDRAFNSIVSQACTIYRSNHEGSTIAANNIGDLEFVQGDMSRDSDGKQYVDNFMCFKVRNNDEMTRFGVLTFVDLASANIYISAFKLD